MRRRLDAILSAAAHSAHCAHFIAQTASVEMQLFRLLCAVCVLAAAAVRNSGALSCPCELVPAANEEPGGGDGNLMWNCRDRLLPAVPTSCWSVNPNVTQVDLFNHHITTFRKGDFDDLWNLRYLNTFKGYLSTVEEGSLRGLTHLEHLDIGFGFLTEVPEEVSHLHQLQVLALEYNLITEIPVDLLRPLVNLRWLILVRNYIESVPELHFLPYLTWLNLEANNVRALPRALLGDLSLPCQLWINDNPLSGVAAATLLPLPNGSELRTNASVIVWAQDEEEKQQLFDNEWRVYDKNQNELELEVMTHTCDEPHDAPSDTVHPCDL